MYRLVEINAWYNEFEDRIDYYEVLYRKLERRAEKKISELNFEERDGFAAVFTLDIAVDQFDGKRIPTVLRTVPPPNFLTIEGLLLAEDTGDCNVPDDGDSSDLSGTGSSDT